MDIINETERSDSPDDSELHLNLEMDTINETETSDSPDDSELRLDLEDLEDAVALSQSTISSKPEMEDTIIWDASSGQVVDNNESSEHQ